MASNENMSPINIQKRSA